MEAEYVRSYNELYTLIDNISINQCNQVIEDIRNLKQLVKESIRLSPSATLIDLLNLIENDLEVKGFNFCIARQNTRRNVLRPVNGLDPEEFGGDDSEYDESDSSEYEEYEVDSESELESEPDDFDNWILYIDHDKSGAHNKGEDCVVCHDTLTEGDLALHKNCKNLLHVMCIQRLYTYKKLCPLCRAKFGSK
jgi:hypothetical protein